MKISLRFFYSGESLL